MQVLRVRTAFVDAFADLVHAADRAQRLFSQLTFIRHVQIGMLATDVSYTGDSVMPCSKLLRISKFVADQLAVPVA